MKHRAITYNIIFGLFLTLSLQAYSEPCVHSCPDGLLCFNNECVPSPYLNKTELCPDIQGNFSCLDKYTEPSVMTVKQNNISYEFHFDFGTFIGATEKYLTNGVPTEQFGAIYKGVCKNQKIIQTIDGDGHQYQEVYLDDEQNVVFYELTEYFDGVETHHIETKNICRREGRIL